MERLFIPLITGTIIILLLSFNTVAKEKQLTEKQDPVKVLVQEPTPTPTPSGNSLVESGQLENCPLCGAVVGLYPTKHSFYIECDNCDLQTGYFETKEELISLWNNRKD